MSAGAVADAVVPLRTVDPDVADSDLAAFGAFIGNARVVCLGENVHFCSEFAKLRDRLLRYLVRELDFSAFVVESGFPEGLLVDEWVRGGPGSLEEIARRGMTYGFGRCAEMHAQLRWMRDWNATAERPVSFYGMDVPGWCDNPGPGVAACLARLPRRDGDEELLAEARLGDSLAAPAPEGSGCEVPSGLYRRVTELVRRAEDSGDEVALRCALGARDVVEFHTTGLYRGPGRNLRNEAMADNLRWILGREQRVLVGAHNVHVQRTPAFDGTTSIGGLLADELADDLVIIGTTRGYGPVPDIDPDAPPEHRFAGIAAEAAPPAAGSLDALLDASGSPLHFLDPSRVPAGAFDSVTGMAAQHTVVDIDPVRSFDGIVHIGYITPVAGVDDDAESGHE